MWALDKEKKGAWRLLDGMVEAVKAAAETPHSKVGTGRANPAPTVEAELGQKIVGRGVDLGEGCSTYL